PLVKKELVETTVCLSQALRKRWVLDVEEPSCDETNCHRNKWRPLHPLWNIMEVVQHVVFSTSVERALPEFVIVVTEEVTFEDNTCEKSTNCQNEERNQHNHRRFMNVMHNIVRSAWLAEEC